MYNSYNSGTYRLGLYDPSLNYGDEGNASLEIVGGSYVLGLKQVNHDITKDGFYSNYIDEETNENNDGCSFCIIHVCMDSFIFVSIGKCRRGCFGDFPGC